MKPMKECNAIRCYQLIPFDQQYCGKHTHLEREKDRRYDEVRNREDREYRKIYQSTRWRKLRKQILLRDDYLCQNCLNNGIYKHADVVDHIVELRDDITKAFDINNLQSLCHSCHNEKTILEKEKRNKLF